MLSVNYHRRGCVHGGDYGSQGDGPVDQFFEVGYSGKTGYGVWDLNSEQYRNFHDFSTFNSYLSQSSANNSFSQLATNLNAVYSSGTARVWGTPTHTNNFESLSADSVGTSHVTNSGRFNDDAFDNANGDHNIIPSALPGTTQGCLWYAMSFFQTPPSAYQGYIGTVFLNFRTKPATGSNGLKEIFYPNTSNPIEALVLHGNASSENNHRIDVYNDLYTGTCFSSKQDPGTNGYHSTSKFSNQDGIWGFREGVHVDGNNGPFLDAFNTGATVSHSYGIQNANSTDSSATTIHWFDQEYTPSSIKVLLWTQFL